MKLSEAIQQVFSKPPHRTDTRMLENILCQLRNMGLKYTEQRDYVNFHLKPRVVDMAEFDEYCRVVDDMPR